MVYKVTFDLRVYDWEIKEFFKTALGASRYWNTCFDEATEIDNFEQGGYAKLHLKEGEPEYVYVSMHTFSDALVKHAQQTIGSAYLEQIDNYLQINHNFLEDSDADQILQLATLGEVRYSNADGEE